MNDAEALMFGMMLTSKGKQGAPRSKTLFSPHTRPHLAFLGNTGRFHQLLGSMRDYEKLEEEFQRTIKDADKASDLKRVEKLENRLLLRKQALDFLAEWRSVMYVTFTEAYLQDVLATCAGIDPALMSESAQSASYIEITSAGNLQELAGELRARWARNFVDKGGPTSWIDRLQRMGARGYPAEMAPLLEELWGIRHIVVHRAGIANLDFCRRHPSFGLKPNKAIKVSKEQVEKYCKTCEEFVSLTDDYVLARYPTADCVKQPPLKD